MRLPPLLLGSFALSLSLSAAPMVMYLSRSPFVLIGETVTVSVASGMSMVDGTYNYKYVPSYDTGSRSGPVAFKFPIFVPSNTDDVSSLVDVTQARLTVDDVKLSPDAIGPLDTHLGPPPKLVPDGTKVAMAIFHIPRDLLQEKCTLHLTYFQPNYELGDKQVAAYFPVLPDFERLKNQLMFSRDDFLVAFQALAGVRLRRISANRAVQGGTPSLIKVHPVDRENIAVTVQAVPPGPSPAASKPAGKR